MKPGRPSNCEPLVEVPKRYALNRDIVTVTEFDGANAAWIHFPASDGGGGQILYGTYTKDADKLADQIRAFCHSHIRAALAVHGIKMPHT